jgi:hypothetical protein
MNWFLTSNSASAKLARTVAQAAIGFLVAYAPQLLEVAHVPDATKGLVVAATMALLSPVMASIGGKLDVPDVSTEAPAPSDNSLKEGDVELSPDGIDINAVLEGVEDDG